MANKPEDNKGGTENIGFEFEGLSMPGPSKLGEKPGSGRRSKKKPMKDDKPGVEFEGLTLPSKSVDSSPKS